MTLRGLAVGLRLGLAPRVACAPRPLRPAAAIPARCLHSTATTPWLVAARTTALATAPRYPGLRFNSSKAPAPKDTATTTDVIADADVDAKPARASPLAGLKSIFALNKGEEVMAEDGKADSSVRKLAELAIPERKRLSAAIVLLVISSSVSMLVPLTIGKIIDFFSSNASTFFGMSFPVAATLLTTAFVIGATANAGRVYLMRTAGQRIIARIRNQAYLQTLRQEPEFADRSAGDIVSRLNADANILGDSVTSNLSDGLRAIITASVGVCAMFWISSKLTMVMLCVVPPISLAAVFYGRYLRKLSNLTQESLGELSKTAEEKLNAFKTVTAYNAQQVEGKLFAERVKDVRDFMHKEAGASAIFFGMTGLTGNLAMLCLLTYGGHLVSTGAITVGDLTSLLIYSGYVGGSVSGLTGFFSGIMKGVGAGQRVFYLLHRQSEIPLGVGQELSPSREGPITFENVRFTYPSRKEVEVLKGIDLTIEPGTSVALVGSSGSGKSSLLTLLDRFYDPTDGRLAYDGTDIREFTPESWRDRIGVVFQDPVLFEGTVHDNIAYGTPGVTRADVEEAARAANCDFIWDLPQGFDTPSKSSLSGGQRQRISIARALVRRPAILILDEATSALDSKSEDAVNHAIDRIIHQQHITVILAAHRLSSIARAERVVVIENGVISEEGRYDVLSRTEGSRFRKLMAAQLLLEQSGDDAKAPDAKPPLPEPHHEGEQILH